MTLGSWAALTVPPPVFSELIHLLLFDARCLGKNRFPDSLKTRVGMLWHNAGRARRTRLIDGSPNLNRTPPPPTFKPGNDCKLNLVPGSRLWKEPISSAISFSSVGHLLVIYPPSPSPGEILHPLRCLLCSVLMSWPIFLWHLSILLWFYMTYCINSWEINMTSLVWSFLNIQIYFHHFDSDTKLMLTTYDIFLILFFDKSNVYIFNTFPKSDF